MFCLWMATMSILLSTVVPHHHHMNRVCMVQEQCGQDGNINDEHTEHHDEESRAEGGNCSIRQMHQFVVDSSWGKHFKCISLDVGSVPFASSRLSGLSPQGESLSLVVAGWQHRVSSPLADGWAVAYGRRGPPSLFWI